MDLEKAKIILNILKETEENNCVITYNLLGKSISMPPVAIGQFLGKSVDQEIIYLSSFVVGHIGETYYLKTIDETYVNQLSVLEKKGIPIHDFSAIPDQKDSRRILKILNGHATEDEKRIIPESRIWFPDLKKIA